MKGFNGLIIENVVQGLGGNNVIAPGDESQNAFAVGFGGRLLRIQFLQEALVPFFDRRNKNNKTFVGVRPVHPVLPDVTDQGGTFAGTHGRIDDVERQRFQIIAGPVRYVGNRNKYPSVCLKKTRIQ